jgi:membrane protein YdbS with pleckstrin-like domain
LFAAYLTAFLKGSTSPVVGMAIIFYLLLVGLGIAFSYFWAELTYSNYKYEITVDTVKIELGVIGKKFVSIPYDRIQNVDIYRGVLERLLGLSDLHVQTAGISGYALTEGHIPGIDPALAEELRDKLIQLAKRPSKQGV